MKVNTPLKLLALVLYFFSLLIVFGLPFYLTPDPVKSIIFSISGGLAYLLLGDVIFRILFKIFRGKPYAMRHKIPFKEIYVEPHPYLPYVFKKKFLCQKKHPSDYPLNRDKDYWFGQFYTNNMGHLNGINGKREVVIPKPEGLFRVNCLGASTTANYILEKDDIFSYPLELGKILHKSFPGKNIEVNNFAMGGYTSAELLIKFLLESIDSNPDMIILYHAYNDLAPSLTADFKSDYSHARKNLAETYHLFKWASKIPYVPFALPNFLLNLLLPQNIKYGIFSAVSKGSISLDDEFKGLDTYKRNIRSLIHICQANGIKVVLSTYCHFLYPQIEDDKSHLKYRAGVLGENDVMRELAREHELPLVDNFNLVPYEEKYFVDSVHFSPHGMQEIAKNISKPIIEHLNSVYN